MFPINWLTPVKLTWLLLINTTLRLPVFSVNVLHAWGDENIQNEGCTVYIKTMIAYGSLAQGQEHVMMSLYTPSTRVSKLTSSLLQFC